MRTDESIWPSYMTKIFSARSLVRELFLKFKNRFRVLLHNSSILHLGATRVKRIPRKRNMRYDEQARSSGHEFRATFVRHEGCVKIIDNKIDRYYAADVYADARAYTNGVLC